MVWGFGVEELTSFGISEESESDASGPCKEV